MAKKNKFNFALLFPCFVAALCGFYGARMIDYISGGIFENNIPFPLIATFLIVALFASYLLATFIHEAGHLVLGLLTGYDFVSFRVGSIAFIKENGKLKRRKFNIVGTAGQCILSYKKVENPADVPYFWYNFGGVFFNLLTALFCVPLVMLSKNAFVIVGFAIFAAVSLMLGIMNILPTKSMGIGTDGYNLLQMKKSPVNRAVIYKIMVMNALQYQGVQIKDMDSSITTFSDEEKQCVFGIGLKILEAALLMYKHDFKASAEICKAVIEDENAYKIYQNECECELMFCMIMNGSTAQEIEEFYNTELKRYIKATEKTYIARKRLLYAYYLIVKKDSEKAAREYSLAQQMSKTYPSMGEYYSEMLLIDYVRDKFSA